MATRAIPRSWTFVRPQTVRLVFKCSLAFGAVICAALAQHAGSADDVPAWVIIVSLLAIAGGAVAFASPLLPGVGVAMRAAHPRRPMAVGIALLIIPTGVATWLWFREDFAITQEFVLGSSTVAAYIWIAGMIAALMALWPGSFHPRAVLRRALAPGRWPLLALEALALVVILAVAAALRLWHLDSQPEGVWFDEADTAASALRMQNLPFQPMSPGTAGPNASLYFYVMSFILRVAGTSMGAVRLDSVFFGLLAVVAVYLVGRQVGGPALGLCAAALLGCMQWAIDFSRMGMLNMSAPSMVCLGIAALIAAMLRPQAFWWALSGVLFGLTFMTYVGADLELAAVSAVVVLRFLLDGRFRALAWPGVLLLPLGFLVGAAPLLVVFKEDGQYVLARINQVSVFNEYADWNQRIAAIETNLRLHLLMFTVAGDSNGRHNLPGAPMLDAITGACFLLGLGITIRRLGHWFFLLLFAWFVACMLGGILALEFEAPQSARTIGAVAPIALIAALPLVLLARAVWSGTLSALQVSGRRLGTREGMEQRAWQARLIASIAAGAVLSIPLGLVFAANSNGYFVQHMNNVSSWADMGGLQAIEGRAALALARQGYEVRVSPDIAGDIALIWAADGFNPPAYDPEIPVPLPVPDGGLALIIPSTSDDVFTYVKRSYPNALISPLAPAFDPSSVQAWVMIILPSDAARNVGVEATFGGGQQAQTFRHLEAAIPWPAGSNRTTPVTVQGTLMLSTADAWQPLALRVGGVRTATITIDGSTWQRAEKGTPVIRLGAGNHLLQISARGRVGSTLQLEWVYGPAAQAVPQWTPMPNVVLGAPTLPTGGLLGLYYSGSQIGTVPDLERVDQTINTYYQNPPENLQFPFATEWTGTVRIDTPGVYGFRLDSTGSATMYIDGASVISDGPDGGAQVTSTSLRAGIHQLRVDYSATGSYLHCYLTWQPPGSGFGPIPPSVTMPAHG
jgi:hypothetical protein